MISRIRPSVLAALTFVMLLPGLVFIERAENRRVQEHVRAVVLSELGTLRAKLEGILAGDLALLRGLVAFVSVHPDITLEEFVGIAREIKQGGAHIRNVGLARNNVISHIFPLAGNEAALGLDYGKIPSQRDAVDRIMETGRMVVAGPVSLVQGGTAIIGRAPIFVAYDMAHHKAGDYWGLASIPIDAPGLFETVGLLNPDLPFTLALRGKDGQSANSGIFFGEPKVFDNNPVTLTVSLPEGSWVLAAQPKPELIASGTSIWIVRLLGGAVIGLLTLLGFRITHDSWLLREAATHDPLTGLPNRVLLQDRLEHLVAIAGRNQARFAVLALDLDNFKPINDTYGHQAGDQALQIIADRIKSCLRSADTVARVGGDEFIVVLGDLASNEDAGNVASKIIDSVARPLVGESNGYGVSVSIGIAIFPEDGDASEALVKRADFAMYASKLAGKNRFGYATPQPRPQFCTEARAEKSAVAGNVVDLPKR